jgi:hypothetical protein
MEAGGWDLTKIDLEVLKESKATFVFGQMNEPPGARARVALSGLTIAEYFRDGEKIFYFSLTTSSVLHKQDQKFLPYLEECLQQ